VKKFALRYTHWIYPNIIGVILYLYFASWIWAPSGEKAFSGGAGDPIIWGTTAFPIIAIFSLINLVWLALILSNISRGGKWKAILVWSFVALAWLVANRYDAYRQHQEIDIATITVPAVNISSAQE